MPLEFPHFVEGNTVVHERNLLLEDEDTTIWERVVARVSPEEH